jgi:hypothetical protein
MSDEYPLSLLLFMSALVLSSLAPINGHCHTAPTSTNLSTSLHSIHLSHLTFILNEQLAIVFPSAKKSQLTTAPLNPKHAKAPRINPQGKASIRIAPTRALSSSGGRRRSHFNSRSLRTNTPRWLVCSLSICLRNTSVQNSGGIVLSSGCTMR